MSDVSILTYKLRKTFSWSRISKLLSAGIEIVIIFAFIAFIVFAICLSIGFITLVLFYNVNFDTVLDGSIITGIVGSCLIMIDIERAERKTQKRKAEERKKNEAILDDLEDKQAQPALEYDVVKTIEMTVVSMNCVTNPQGIVVRELLFRDPTGRVIEYGKKYSQKNLNTIYYAVQVGHQYEIQWEFETYDPTGKKNSYYKILKINNKDVDLNN